MEVHKPLLVHKRNQTTRTSIVGCFLCLVSPTPREPCPTFLCLQQGRLFFFCKYERSSRRFQSPELNRVTGDVQSSALSNEFRMLPVRLEEERPEPGKSLERVPIPVDEKAARFNVLIQPHILRLKLDRFVLVTRLGHGIR
ncbi:hypothetical protein M378DRAFT_399363 [Amanita muscaria Koide BX008]|uniref:SEC63 domain-containing protein n=1 Tax=Amanita muscaria (strain Koide BX008) TaxID=946122 RepID=A0A0C2WKI7_AMAMK|nr:hypothetical protein M378DRAFT_399363 [Amanita muscaria Koide BX008]